MCTLQFCLMKGNKCKKHNKRDDLTELLCYCYSYMLHNAVTGCLAQVRALGRRWSTSSSNSSKPAVLRSSGNQCWCFILIMHQPCIVLSLHIGASGYSSSILAQTLTLLSISKQRYNTLKWNNGRGQGEGFSLYQQQHLVICGFLC